MDSSETSAIDVPRRRRPVRAALRRVLPRRKVFASPGRRGRLRGTMAGVVGCSAVIALGAVGLAGAALDGDDVVETIPSGDDSLPPSTTSPPSTTTTAPTTTTTAPTTTTTPPPPTLPVVHRIETADPVVFITIDDGSHVAPDLYGFLRSQGLPTTGFLIGWPLDTNPDLWRGFVAAGGNIQNHSENHLHLTTLPREQQQREICGNADRIQHHFGIRPTLFRPPYGEYDDNIRRIAESCGHTALIHWSAEVAAGRIHYAASDRLRPGDIVLLHFEPGLVWDLQVLLDQMRSQGLSAGNLQQYLPASPAGL